VPAADRFVGRETERALVRAELEAALRGEGRLVLLVGEPGIGKTRIAKALAAEARERGAAAAWGRCHAREGAPAYWPIVQALAACAEEAPGAPAEAIADVLPLLRSRETPQVADRPPERERFELFDRVVRALAAAARAQPLVLVIDDLHWADEGSLLLLEFLARELGSIPLLVVATLRAEPREDARGAELLAAVLRLGTSLPLAGLARSAVEDLLRDRLERAPGAPLVERVLEVTDGNPFFVIELAQLLAARSRESGDGAALGSAIPPGVQELLRQRLEPLAPESLRLLEAAAVVGRVFELGPLAGALGAAPGALLGALRAPLALGLVKEVPGALRRYAFGHALLREALYQRLSPAQRSALHGAVAEALEAEPADEERLPALAHHFFEAAQAGDPGKAIRYGCEAGERALRLLAFEEAVRQFERVLSALALGGEESVRPRALAGLGEACRGVGDSSGADAAFREAVALARRLGSAVFADTVLRFSRARAELSLLDAEMNELLEEALAGSVSAAVRARLLARLAVGLHFQPGGEARRRALSDEALALAREIGDPQTLGFVLARRLVGLLGPDGLEERLAIADEMLRTASLGHAAELEALATRIDALAELGDRAGLDHALTVFEQKANALREPFFLWTAASLRAALALLEGRYDEGERLATEALALGRRAQTRTPLLRFAQQIFELRGWQGRVAEIEPLVQQGAAETRVVPAWRCALAALYAVAGRDGEARRELDALAARDFEDIPRDSNWLTALSLLASVSARLADVPRAARLYELLRPYAGRVAVARFAVLVAPVDLRLGSLASLLGRHEEADAHFDAAWEMAKRMRALSWQAEIRYFGAEWLRRRAAPADRERALALLDEAEALAREAGMGLVLRWVGECREELAKSAASAAAVPRARAVGEARHGAVVTLVPRATAAAASPPGARAGSFRRDGEVWTLVFEGRTTRLRHMLGLVHLSRLLGEPGREVHAAELAAAAHAGQGGAPHRASAGDAGEHLDARARSEYAARLRDAREELEEAERRNDRGRSERLGDEIERLAAELSRGFGLGGRARRAGAASERARLSVTRAIRYAIDKIGEHDPALAEHLRHGVRTGVFCAYEPSSRDPVSWAR
jgi:hypothetical protein